VGRAAAARPAHDDGALPLLRGELALGVVLPLPGLRDGGDLVGGHHVDGAAAPAGAGEPAAVGAVVARDAAQLVDLGGAALVQVAARVLGGVEHGAEAPVVGGRVNGRVGGTRGRRGLLFEDLHELQHAQGLLEDVQGALAQLEAVGAHRELGHEDPLELGRRHAEDAGDLLAGVALRVGEGVLGDGDELAELGLGGLLAGGAVVAPGLLIAVGGEVGVVEAVQGDAERRGVPGQLGAAGVEGGVEVGAGHAALDDAQVVVDGAGDLLVGGDEGLGDEKRELRVGGREEDGAGGQGGDEGDEEGGAALGEDGGGLVHAGVVVRWWLTETQHILRQLRLVDRLLAVGQHDGQGGGAHEGGAGAEAAADGDVAVHEDLHALGPEGGAVLAAQQAESAAQAALEVVGPLVDFGVDGHVAADGHLQDARRVLVGLGVGDAHGEGVGVVGRGVVGDGEGEDGVGGDGHGQDRVERVVDVLADDVHAARGAGDDGGRVAVLGLELRQQRGPALRLDGQGIFGVDVGERGRGGDGAGHDGRWMGDGFFFFFGL
ncbi:hypothetical protein CTA1_5506, partial [Colletotrichum tanaceti]